MNSTTNALPIEYKGRKIDRYGLAERVIELLCSNMPKQNVVKKINEENPDIQISILLLDNWLLHQKDTVQKMIKESQYRQLLQHVWDWERQGIELRQDALKRIKQLTEGYDADSIEDMRPHERAEIAKIIKAELAVQKSGEDFMGISGKDGKRYDVNVTVKVDLLEKMKKKLKIIDIECEDVTVSEKKK